MKFADFKNSKKQGDFGLGRAISFFAENGLTISVPLTDSQDYDLVVDVDGHLKKVQIKTSRYRNRKGMYTINLSIKGGNRSFNTVKMFDCSAVDYIFIVTDSNELYLIPTLGLSNKTSLSLGKKFERFRWNGEDSNFMRLAFTEPPT